jgi:predicted dehydrogenase
MADAPPIRWGILGTGTIARAMAAELRALPDAALLAVGSRAQATADAFAASFGIPRSYAAYELVADDPDVDVVYVATPHALHRQNALACLDAGKAVLCEKPFALNEREAREMVGAARARGGFLMEAMWTRFLPAVDEALRRVGAGEIGEVRMVSADFGFRDEEPEPRSLLFDRLLGGGALLDVGVYPVWLAVHLLGEPQRVASLADVGATGVDEQCAAVLGFADGALATLHAAIRTETGQHAEISGTRGRIRLHAPWWRAAGFTLSRPDQPDQVVERPPEGSGYRHEAREVMRCVRAGLAESERMPHADTLRVMRTLDRIREPWGLRYPGE